MECSPPWLLTSFELGKFIHRRNASGFAICCLHFHLQIERVTETFALCEGPLIRSPTPVAAHLFYSFSFFPALSSIRVSSSHLFPLNYLHHPPTHASFLRLSPLNMPSAFCTASHLFTSLLSMPINDFCPRRFFPHCDRAHEVFTNLSS